MKIRLFRPLARAVLFAGSVAVCAQLASAQQPAQPGTSKVYVVDATGESHIVSGQKVEPLVKNGVHSLEGSSIETKANATDALVLSNGTALYVTPETRFEVQKFLQQPFAPNRTDLDSEPSISHLQIRLSRGSLGVCTAKLAAGSSMVYQTPHASLNVRGRRMLIETSDDETRVVLLEGSITVVPTGGGAGQVLQGGQQAVIRAGSPGEAALQVGPIPEGDVARNEEVVALACISRRTVFFESVDTPAGADLLPVRTAPATPPTQFTVSPARIDS